METPESDKESPKSGPKTDKPEKKSAKPDPKRRKLLRWGVIGLAVLVALIAWIATRGGDESSSEPAPAEAVPPRIVTEAELKEATLELRQPIYWAGAMPGTELELTELGRGGGVQVTYLPEGAEAGADPAQALTIGSYRLADPRAAVEGYAGRPGSQVLHGAGGVEVATSEDAPGSAYFASPDNSVQVEVYSPSPKRSLTLALSGKVKPVE